MATRSLNKVLIIGNLTRAPELKYIPQGTAVANFGIATNRDWVGSDGERQEAAEFHNVVAWGKLAELCDQLLKTGSKVYVEGRLQTRDWVGDDGKKRYKTEVVINQMILLGNGKDFESSNFSGSSSGSAPKSEEKAPAPDTSMDEEVDLDEILADTNFDLEEEEDEE